MIIALLLGASLSFSFSGPKAQPSPSAPVAMTLPVPQLEQLPNGLTVAWFLSDSLPIVDIAVLVQSGSRDEPTGKAGTAELVSTLLDRGAGGMSAQQIGRAIENLGASRFSEADEDTLSVGVHGLAPDAPVLLDLLGKMVARPEFPEAEVLREKDRLLARWSMVADYGDALAGLAFGRLVASGTTYGRGSFVSAREFAAVTRKDVTEFHQRHFTPKNAVLMVVGRVDKADFKKRIDAAFGQWKGEAPKREWKQFTDTRITAAPGQVVLVDRPGLTQAQVRIGFRGPKIDVPERYSLLVANALLGEYFGSRLNAVIRDKLGLTYSIASSFQFARDLGRFAVVSATRNEQAGALLKKTLEILGEMKTGPIPPEEVRMAKEYLVGGYPLSVSTLGAVASRWLAGYIFNLGPGYLNEFVPKVQAVTQAEVKAAVQKHFDLSHLTIVVVGDGKEVSKSLSEAGFSNVRRATAKDLL